VTTDQGADTPTPQPGPRLFGRATAALLVIALITCLYTIVANARAVGAAKEDLRIVDLMRVADSAIAALDAELSGSAGPHVTDTAFADLDAAASGAKLDQLNLGTGDDAERLKALLRDPSDALARARTDGRLVDLGSELALAPGQLSQAVSNRALSSHVSAYAQARAVPGLTGDGVTSLETLSRAAESLYSSSRARLMVGVGGALATIAGLVFLARRMGSGRAALAGPFAAGRAAAGRMAALVRTVGPQSGRQGGGSRLAASAVAPALPVPLAADLGTAPGYGPADAAPAAWAPTPAPLPAEAPARASAPSSPAAMAAPPVRTSVTAAPSRAAPPRLAPAPAPIPAAPIAPAVPSGLGTVPNPAAAGAPAPEPGTGTNSGAADAARPAWAQTPTPLSTGVPASAAPQAPPPVPPVGPPLPAAPPTPAPQLAAAAPVAPATPAPGLGTGTNSGHADAGPAAWAPTQPPLAGVPVSTPSSDSFAAAPVAAPGSPGPTPATPFALRADTIPVELGTVPNYAADEGPPLVTDVLKEALAQVARPHQVRWAIETMATVPEAVAPRLAHAAAELIDAAATKAPSLPVHVSARSSQTDLIITVTDQAAEPAPGSLALGHKPAAVLSLVRRLRGSVVASPATTGNGTDTILTVPLANSGR
jgi:hypothetical protein